MHYRSTLLTLALLVGGGSVYSFLFWIVPTIQIIMKYGILASIHSTHFFRIAQDVATFLLSILICQYITTHKEKQDETKWYQQKPFV